MIPAYNAEQAEEIAREQADEEAREQADEIAREQADEELAKSPAMPMTRRIAMLTTRRIRKPMARLMVRRFNWLTTRPSRICIRTKRDWTAAPPQSAGGGPFLVCPTGHG